MVKAAEEANLPTTASTVTTVGRSGGSAGQTPREKASHRLGLHTSLPIQAPHPLDPHPGEALSSEVDGALVLAMAGRVARGWEIAWYLLG